MNVNEVHVQIMWKEIAIIFLLIFLLRCMTDVYIITIYKRINSSFYLGEWDGLEEKILRHRKICNVFSDGPFNKNIRVRYNGLCMALASMRLMQGDEADFLQQLNYVKKEEEYEMKAFILALYYRSKEQHEEAEKQYHKFSKCNSQSQNLKIVLDVLFEKQKEIQKDEAYRDAIRSFQNPAILKLFKDNNILLQYERNDLQ